MTAYNFQDRRIAKKIRISANWEQASSAIWWQDIEADPSDKATWKSTPYQVADARHNRAEALRMVRDWLDVE